VSTFGIVVLVVLVVVVLLILTGFIASRRREEGHADEYHRHLLEADEALERAKAADKGWDRDVLHTAARDALEHSRPGWQYEELHLVLVDDREGAADDRAHLVAVGPQGDTRIVLARHDDRWSAEQVEPAG
jgi:hypothetical protein